MKLFNYLRTLTAGLKRDTIEEDVDVTSRELTMSVIPSYSLVISSLEGKYKNKDLKNLTTKLMRNLSSNEKDPLVAVMGLLTNASVNMVSLKKEVGSFGKDVFPEALTTRKGVVLRAVDHIGFVSTFAMDLLHYYVARELGAAGGSDTVAELSKQQEFKINEGLIAFAALLDSYGVQNHLFVKKLNSGLDIVVNDSNRDAVVGAYTEDKLDPFVSSSMIKGFDSNPIYHIRIRIAEWQVKRYKATQDKHRSLELRLLYLTQLNNNSPDPKLEQEIVYIQNRIEKYEYEMAKFEESLED